MSSAHLTQLRKWLTNSPPGEWVLQRIRELLIGALRQGPVPKHVAFVMDGNRRYARTRRMETIEGHHLGFEALAKVLEVCYKSGVEVVTIYAFSIENFKRTKHEVDALMDMAKTKLNQMAQHGDLLHKYGARVRIIGQRELIRKDVLEVVERAEQMTKNNGEAVLNICFPYTARHEITVAIRETVRDFSVPLHNPSRRGFSEAHIKQTIRSKQLHDLVEEDALNAKSNGTLPEDDDSETSTGSATSRNDQPPSSRTSPSLSPVPRITKRNPQFKDAEAIDVDVLNRHTFTGYMPPLDLLIRTSGVQRLSDFMLWQCHEQTKIVFLDCLWPEFDLWQFLPVLVEWQWRKERTDEARVSQAHGKLHAA